MKKTEYLIFDRPAFERFADKHTAESLLSAVMEDRQHLTPKARVVVTTDLKGANWSFKVTRQLPQNGDLRERPSMAHEILYISAGHSESNIAKVTDITNSGELEGLGLNTWLLDLAFQDFLQVSGPDPWLEGKLSSTDHNNPRRIPFWEKHIAHGLQVNEEGNGRFLGPWVRSYNPYRSQFAPILVNQTGNPPARKASLGYGLYELEHTPALLMISRNDNFYRNRRWKPIWKTRTD